jgi:dimethyl-sulfide monooxygenase
MKRIILNAFDMSCVTHQAPGLWRHPANHADRYTSLHEWVELAKLLERGGFDALFLADVLGVYDVWRGSGEAALTDADQVPLGDPVIPLSAMAYATSASASRSPRRMITRTPSPADSRPSII